MTPTTRSVSFLVSAALVAMTAGACVGDAGVRCADGTLCPDDTTCALVAGVTYCASADQLGQCAGAADGTTCDLAGQPGVCRDQVCVRSGCGDGVRAGAEQCDGADLGAATSCRDLGFYGDGALTCADDCTFDQAACAGLGRCGDGTRDPEEQCDGEAPADVDCRVGGFYDAAGLACNAACRYDFAGCTGRCGDGVVTGPEECDGAVPAALDSCGEHGFHDEADPVTCGTDCRYDLTACDQFCGDGVVSGDEQCDGAALGVLDSSGDGAVDCKDLGYYQGALSCLPNCQRNLAACAGRCGDGQKQAVELCDGTDFGSATCTSSGFYTGTLGCGADCQTLSTTACSGRCGDGAVNGPEVCDGAAIRAGFACGLFGYYRGELGCAPGCAEVTTSTCAGYCGDGVPEPGAGERCDGAAGESSDLSCAGAGAPGDGPLGCDVSCRPSFERCTSGAWLPLAAPGGGPGLHQPIDVWVAGNRDAWVLVSAGGQSQIHRHVDGAWVDLPAIGGTTSAIWASADGDRVLVATTTGLVRLTRASPTWQWTPSSSPPGGATITDLWGQAGTELWLTTAAGQLFHGDGVGAWTEVVVPGPPGPLHAVAGSPDGAIVVGGANRMAWNFGAGWLGAAAPFTVHAAFARSRSDAWLVGRTSSSRQANLHWTGSTWQSEPLQSDPGGPQWGPLFAVHAGAADDVWVVGGNGSSQAGSGGLLLNFRWTEAPMARYAFALEPSTLGWIAAAGGSDVGDLWAAIAEPTGALAVARRGAPGWRPRERMPMSSAENVRDVAASTSATWFIDQARVARHDNRRSAGDPGRVVTLPTPPLPGPPCVGGPLEAVWARGDDDVMVFRGDCVQRHLGGVWTTTPLPGRVFDAWGSDGEVFAVGEGRLHHFDGASWTSELVGANLRSVHGTSPADVWLVGDAVHHRTGPAQYQQLPAPPDSLVMHAVWAASPTYVIVVGAVGASRGVAHWIGDEVDGAWVDVDPFAGPDVFHAVAGTSPTDVWAVGERGGGAYAAHWDGATWTPSSLGGSRPLRALAVAGPRDLWAVGDGDAGPGNIIHLDHRLPGLTGGACAGAIALGCSRITAIRIGTLDRGPVRYVLDAPVDGFLSAHAMSFGRAVELRVLGRGADGACDPVVPLATGTPAVTAPLATAQRVYLEVRAVGPGPAGRFDLLTSCTKQP
ncbi:MAG: DUF4215 domain-containing protein [Kofleriaceae bacterium]|nr:DUF4215 domain-containing protein [Kofleriaceae bacterium]